MFMAQMYAKCRVTNEKHLGCLGYIGDYTTRVYTWNRKQPFINGCFNWMIPNLYVKNGCFTKHPLQNGCLGYQVGIINGPS